MGDKTNIEWTDATWNPVRGCSRVSAGCEHCYAEAVAKRFSGPGLAYEGLADERGWTRVVRLVPEHLADPLHWRRPRRIFVNSMSDLFHEGLKDEEIAAVFGVMAAAPQHTFQVLTKRSERMRQWFAWASRESCARAGERYGDLYFHGFHQFNNRHIAGPWPLPNVWLGVSVENQRYADERIPELLATPAAVRFVSYEPALEAVDFSDLLSLLWVGRPAIHWVIVGGESGPGARPFDVAWARSAVAQCRAAGVAVFVKQLGDVATMDEAAWRKGTGAGLWPILDSRGERFRDRGLVQLLVGRKGKNMAAWPEDLRVREFPQVTNEVEKGEVRQ